MSKILVAVDFSEGTESICKYSIEIAKRNKAEIRLFHSYFDKILVSESSFPTGIDTDTMINKKVVEEIKEQAESDIIELGKCMKQTYPEIILSYSLQGGNPNEQIIKETEEFNPDLIIMGSSGRGKKGIISGSTAQKIMCNAEVPVLAIPLGHSFVEFTKALYLTEFDDKDTEVLSALDKTFTTFKVKIHCIHLEKGGEDKSEKMQILKQKVSKLSLNSECYFELIKCDDINKGIENSILENQINIIAFLSHKRNILSEIFTHKFTKRNLFQADIPLLAFRA